MKECENGRTGGRRSHCGKGGVSLLWVYRHEGVSYCVERREKEVLELKDER